MSERYDREPEQAWCPVDYDAPWTAFESRFGFRASTKADGWPAIRIEQRLFSHISMNWPGHPFTSHEVVIDLIGATTTGTGLQVHAELAPDVYATKVKITGEQMNATALDRHDFHGEWNYTLRPEPVP